MRTIPPGIAGSAPNRRRQSRSLIRATGCAPARVSSSGRYARPATGRTRSVSKYSGDTTSPSICSGSPPPLMAMLADVYDAIVSNDVADCCNAST